MNLRQILRYASRKGCRIFEIFSSEEQGEHLAATRGGWDERQRLMVTQEEKARRNVQEVDDEMNQNWTAVYQWTEKNMLRYLEDSESLKVSTGDLKEQVRSPDESSVNTERIARQARSEQSKKFFQISRQSANEVLIASMARWEEHLRMLVVLERECLAVREEVEHSNVRQEVLTFLIMQKVARDDCSEADFPGFERVGGAEDKEKRWKLYNRSTS